MGVMIHGLVEPWRPWWSSRRRPTIIDDFLRGVVDNSYDYAINVHFNSVADEKAYQSEPIHLEFIENHNEIWEKVIVYDNLVR